MKLSANQCQAQLTSSSEVRVAEDDEAASAGPGVVTVWRYSWVLGSGLGEVDHLAHKCCDTEGLRGLVHWNLPSLGFCGMRSGFYKSEVINAEDCRFFSRNPS